MSNTAPSRADPVVVFPVGRWCPPQETSQPHPPPLPGQELRKLYWLLVEKYNILIMGKVKLLNCPFINIYITQSRNQCLIWRGIAWILLPKYCQCVRCLYLSFSWYISNFRRLPTADYILWQQLYLDPFSIHDDWARSQSMKGDVINILSSFIG